MLLTAGEMGEKRAKLSTLTGCVTQESVKTVAESVGVSDLPDATLTYIADEMTFRLRHTVQVCPLSVVTTAVKTGFSVQPETAFVKPVYRIVTS